MKQILTTILLLLCLNGYGQDKTWNIEIENRPDSADLKYIYVSCSANNNYGNALLSFMIISVDYPTMQDINDWASKFNRENNGVAENITVMHISEISYEFYKTLFIKPQSQK